MPTRRRKEKAFTLVELLVVTAILGIFITLSVIAVQRYQRTAVDTRVEGSLSQIRNLAAMIYTDNSNYDGLCAEDDTINDNFYAYPTLKAIEDDVRNFTGQNPKCYASSIDYCVQTILINGGSFCVDATGYAGEENISCGEKDKGKTNIKCSAP